MKRRLDSSRLQSTTDFPTPPYHHGKIFYVAGIFLSFIVGFFASHVLWPRHTTTERKVYVEPRANQYSSAYHLDIEIQKHADARSTRMLQSCMGVLEIKDNEAQTVLHKRAAVGSKQGFVDLKNDFPYLIQSYIFHRETGYGIADDGQHNLFLIVWQPGKIKVPTANPGAIKIVSGRRIEVSN